MARLDNSVVPKWNEEPSALDAFEERVILCVLVSMEFRRGEPDGREPLPFDSRPFMDRVSFQTLYTREN